ncbi:RNA polymerase sigma factor RpoD [Lachnospiraceae bacterium TWA4]|nr:RNA polymerase sigma factor RpoD [Lachnospiraceae bacterium TWA4]
MNEQSFMQLIESLKDQAAKQNNSITFSQVHEKTKELGLSDEQLQAIYTYLESERIKISDNISVTRAKKKMAPIKDSTRLNIQETQIYRTYLQEIEGISPCTQEEIIRLFEVGDEFSKNRLVEGSLSYVADYVKKYVGRGLPITDLIQEANMALMLHVSEASAMNYFEALEEKIDDFLEQMIEENQGSASIKNKIADRANRLMELSAELAEEFERQPTLEELANRMHISEDEVREVMKQSISAMDIDETKL